MSGHSPPVDLDAAVDACVDTLSAFGVTRADVRGRWGYTGGDDLADAVRSVCRRVTESPAAVVRGTIVDTARSVDAPARYWDSAIGIQLDRVFGALGGAVEVLDATGTPVDEGGTEEPFRIAVTDARGETHATTFRYPQTPMGRDNYAAAIYAVERGLLGETGYTFAAIDGPGNRWRFALVDARELAGLRERYGDRVRIAGEPILSAHAAADYVPDGDGGGVHTPPWVDQYDDGSVAAVSAGEVFDVEASIEARDAPAVEEVLDGTDPEEIARTAAASATADDGVVGEDFDGFVDDLSAASVPEATPVGVATADAGTEEHPPETGTGGVVQIDPGAAGAPEGPDGDGLDRAFAEIERAAATETAADHDEEMGSKRHETAVAAMARGVSPDELPADIFGVEKADAPEFEWVGGDDLAGE